MLKLKSGRRFGAVKPDKQSTLTSDDRREMATLHRLLVRLAIRRLVSWRKQYVDRSA